MRKAGLIVWQAHQAAAEVVEPGVTTAEINEVVERVLADHGAEALFKSAPGQVPFPAATCTSVDCEVVHGIPGPRKLREGEIVSVDIGVRLDGWCADAAITRPVGAIDPEVQRLLDVTEGALRLAIQWMGRKSRWRQVARKIESFVKPSGFSVVEDLLGHGIGREMWEPPQVPNYFTTTVQDIKLRPGVVLAVEPMVNMGSKELRNMPDHWTIAAADGRPSAHFEHTIAVTENGLEILTAGPEGQGWGL